MKAYKTHKVFCPETGAKKSLELSLEKKICSYIIYFKMEIDLVTMLLVHDS